MPQQPELTSHPLPASPAPQPGTPLSSSPSAAVPGSAKANSPQGHEHTSQRIPRWLERAELFLRVLLRMYIGLAVCYLPWSRFLPILQPLARGFWDQNPLFLEFPTLAIYATKGMIRGLISGLGILNLWLAFVEAIHDGTDER